MDLGIRGKSALVTGGATGLGGAIARALAAEGVKVFITSRSPEKVEKFVADQQAAGAVMAGAAVDLVLPDGPRTAYEKAVAAHGPLDIIVNNAGDTLGITDPYCSVEDWRRVFRLNLEVAVEINNLAIPHMKAQDWGRILNVSAGASMENSGPVPYCASKAALTAYSRSQGRVLAIEARDVIMSAILPGVFLTEEGHWSKVLVDRPEHAERYLRERCPAGRFGHPDELAPMALLLCSKLATFCHGSIVPVDAGQAKHFFNIS